MRVLFGALTAAAFVMPVASSLAADIPLPVKAPVIAPVALYNWTGFYVGGNAGYSWGRARTTQTDSTTSTSTTECFRDSTSAAITGALSTVICAPNTTITFPIVTGPTTTTATTSGRANVDGFIGGLQAGYNYQVDRSWLFGFEADFQYSGERGGQSDCSVAGCPAGSAFGSSSHRLKWFGTARGRVGLLPTDRVLLYATGGLVYGQIDSDYVSGINGVTLLAGRTSTWRAGWTVGGGVEGAISDRWTVKAEYLYADYGSFGANLGTGAAVTTVGPFVFLTPPAGTRTTTTSTVSSAVSTRFTDNVFRVGLNYRFGPDAVVARY
jgi:outer membrane immunogenic protein